jgi:sentrin-specific protease 7
MGVRVEAAVCQPNLRYAASEGQGSCFLRQAEGAELLAFTEDGKLAEPHRWLKITGKAKTLTYHPQSNYIKVTQSMDQASSTPIGGLMILQLSSNADASWVAGRAGKSLGIQVLQERERYLCPTCPPILHQADGPDYLAASLA